MKFTPHQTRAFTVKANGTLHALVSDISISEAYDPLSGLPGPTMKAYMALWDTGATGTVISRRIAQELNIQSTGRQRVQVVGSGGQPHEYDTDTYLVNLYLPNKVAIAGVRVSEGEVAGADVLVGMDVITGGDLAITNESGKTQWTFRVPPNESIDFVEEINEYNKKHPPPMSPEEMRRQRGKRKAESRKRRGK